MASVRKSLAISFAEKYSTMVIQFFSTLILARLLTPEEIGIFSIGALIVGFAHMIRDFGVSNYIVQEKELTINRLRSAFTVTLLLAWGAALLLFVLSGPLSRFYDQPGILEVIHVLAISFLFIPFSSTVFGLLRREMNFAPLFWIGLVSAIVNAITSISLAFLGYGFMSLAWATVASALTTVAMTLFFRPPNAQFTPSFIDFRRVFTFGSKSSVASLAIELGYSTPELVIGKVMDFTAVGFFSRAQGLATLFNKLITSAVQTVAIPYFAKEHRENNNIATPYLHSVDLILGISWPFYCFLAIFSYETIIVLFGDQWENSVPLAQILCVAFALRMIPSVNGWVLTSIGAIHENMLARLFWEGCSAVLVVLAASYGLEAICYALIIGNIFGSVIFHYYLNKKTQIRLTTLLPCIFKNILMTAILFTIFIFLHSLLKTYFTSDFLVLLLGFIFFALSWLIIIFLLKHTISKEIHILYIKFKKSRPTFNQGN